MTVPSPLPTIDVRDIIVPIEAAVSMRLGPIDSQVVQRLEALGYDQAPVLRDGTVIGVAPTTRLRTLLDGATPLAAGDPEFASHRRPAEEVLHVGDALEMLESERAVLITSGGSAGAPVIGMVTISDLNRHAIRQALYDLLSEVESRLATLLALTVENEEETLRHLGELEQIRLLGNYHYMRRGGVELSLLAGTTLSQLLKIAREQDDVLERLGYSKSQFKKRTGSLPNLRNKVMHPVRPLVYNHADVGAVLRRVRRLAELCGRLRRALSETPDAPLL